jgi:hypothetical protein
LRYDYDARVSCGAHFYKYTLWEDKKGGYENTYNLGISGFCAVNNKGLCIDYIDIGDFLKG